MKRLFFKSIYYNELRKITDTQSQNKKLSEKLNQLNTEMRKKMETIDSTNVGSSKSLNSRL